MIEIVNRATGEILDADSVPGLARIAALHHLQLQRLDQLEATVEDLLADHDPGDPGSTNGGAAGGGRVQRPVVWHRLNPSEAHRTWQVLAAWVGWLRGRYPLANQVPLCWWRHPELVEELTAVWLAWHDAYLDKDAPLTLAADWHARVLPDFLRRIGAGGWNIACQVDHRPRVTSLYDPRPVDDPDAFQQHLTAVSHTHPPEQQPTAPATEPQAARPGTATEPPEDTMDENTVDDTTMQTALQVRDARRLGELPGSPVAYQSRYWRHDGDQWTPVQDPETIAFLEHAQRRLALANQAINADDDDADNGGEADADEDDRS